MWAKDWFKNLCSGNLFFPVEEKHPKILCHCPASPFYQKGGFIHLSLAFGGSWSSSVGRPSDHHVQLCRLGTVQGNHTKVGRVHILDLCVYCDDFSGRCSKIHVQLLEKDQRMMKSNLYSVVPRSSVNLGQLLSTLGISLWQSYPLTLDAY